MGHLLSRLAPLSLEGTKSHLGLDPASYSFVERDRAAGETHYQGIEKVWKKVREKLNMPKLRIHDLRHSFAAVGATHGQSLPIIGAILGHREVSTTQRYAHLADLPVKQATNDITARISAAMLGQNPKQDREVGQGSQSLDKAEIAILIENLQQLLKTG